MAATTIPAASAPSSPSATSITESLSLTQTQNHSGCWPYPTLCATNRRVMWSEVCFTATSINSHKYAGPDHVAQRPFSRELDLSGKYVPFSRIGRPRPIPEIQIHENGPISSPLYEIFSCNPKSAGFQISRILDFGPIRERHFSFGVHKTFISNNTPGNNLPPVLSTCLLHTNSGCGKERRILFGPW